MATDLHELVAYCDRLLDIHAVEDFSPNGLQVEGKDKVDRIISGVTACQALLEEAVSAEADLVLVHHGYFWKGEDPVLTGMKGRRIATLMRSSMSLLAYHLPLDRHPGVGNNAELARVLGVAPEAGFGELGDTAIGLGGNLAADEDPEDFCQRVEETLSTRALHVSGPQSRIRGVAICSGGAPDLIGEAAAAGYDLFLTGESNERVTHAARELGIHFLAAGHHATERLGVQALGQNLAERFGLRHTFVDIPNPA